MALATASGLAGQFRPVIMAPPGPALKETERLGFEAVPFSGAWQFASVLRRLLSQPKRVVFLATGVMHSSVYLALNQLYRRWTAHIHLVHGGAEERLSYGRKKKLNGRPVRFVAVSNYVRERLIANGVDAGQISVIENFLPDLQINTAPRRACFQKPGTRRVVVVSRLDPEKRVDVLLDALERHPELRGFEFRVYGSGWNADALRRRAAAENLPVEFRGFSENIGSELAASDLLLHLCPTEPFGLAILEAMAARIPVLTPDAGGAGSLVANDKSGFHFHANDPDHLAQRLLYIDGLTSTRLNQVICESQRTLRTRFSEQSGIGEYRRLILEGMS
jgi:glycosyltransferase involved in cell wall biosynthesis